MLYLVSSWKYCPSVSAHLILLLTVDLSVEQCVTLYGMDRDAAHWARQCSLHTLGFSSGCSMIGKVLEDSLLHQGRLLEPSARWCFYIFFFKRGGLQESQFDSRCFEPCCFFRAAPSTGAGCYWGAVCCRQCACWRVVASLTRLCGLLSTISLFTV